MGGATRLLHLLATPLSLLRPRSSSSRYCLGRLSLRPLSSNLSHQSLQYLTIKSTQRVHTQSNSLEDDYFPQQQPRQHHPWPEWCKLVHALAPAAEAHGIFPEDEFVSYEYLSQEFVRSATSCLAFDILWMLSTKHIEVVVEDGTPFLFKSALDTVRRMRSFLGRTGINVLESDKAQTVDLMKYLLSYASNPTGVSSEMNDLCSRDLIELSVRDMLSELAEVIYRLSVSNLSTPEQHQVSGYYGQTPRPIGQNIKMKRGDWICPRCSFMNYARNVKCLECEEPRPKRQLTGGEWECPRNTQCLRCNCKRPGQTSFDSINSRPGLGYNNGDYANNRDMDRGAADNEEKAQRWFSKVSQLNNGSDLSSEIADADFPEIMPPRKGVNRFEVSTRKTPLERRLANSQGRRNSGNDSHPEGNESNKKFDASLGRSLDRILSQKLTLTETDDRNNREQNTEIVGSTAPRWFNRVTELHDAPTTVISKDDFPEIMPMRSKGEKRVADSRKNSHSLTSETYKRLMAGEQASDSKFVPFVPFPSDYFCKMDKPQSDSINPTVKSTDEAYSLSRSLGMNPVKSDDARQGDEKLNQGENTESQQTGRGNWSSLNHSVNTGETPSGGYLYQISPGFQSVDNDGCSSRYSGESNAFQTGEPTAGNSTQISFTTQHTGNFAGITIRSPENQGANMENQQTGRGTWTSNHSVTIWETQTNGYQTQNFPGSQAINNDGWRSRFLGESNEFHTGEPTAGDSAQNSFTAQRTSNFAGSTIHSPENQGAITENRQTGRGNWSSTNHSVNIAETTTSGHQYQDFRGFQSINNDGWNSRYLGESNAFQTGAPIAVISTQNSFITQRTSNFAGSTINSPENQGANAENWQTGRGNLSSSNHSVNIWETQTSGYQIQNSPGFQSINNDGGSSRYSGESNAFQPGEPTSGNLTQNSFTTQCTSSFAGSTTHSPENHNPKSGWSGKSLEGSVVKETDPLDMSEEAKAERWFRRVAEIKNISELSQIPDEDFPSIMPMRKGVNRFVLSKRITPLQRRLTSLQHRRNLLVVSSDPVQKEIDDSS